MFSSPNIDSNFPSIYNCNQIDFYICVEAVMGISIQTNLLAMQADRNMKINTKSKASQAEKLSSGYRIGKAADDAAGLSISEKLRWQIRGLDRGSRNGEDGISWVQVGDAALNEVHDILHRMTELTVQSLNDTNTALDRAALQAEYDSLQSEIDKIAEDTTFNTKPVFDDHKESYYQYTGNVVWDQSQPHAVFAPYNDLTIEYHTDSTAPAQTVSVTIPEGIYTTQELMDELDDAFAAAGVADLIGLEFTEDGTCNLNLEGGELIDKVSGGLSYLLYDTYNGGSLGALIGTTKFLSETATLRICNQNNELKFTIEDTNGNKQEISLTIANGDYTRSELIDKLNEVLTNAGTTIRAEAYGQSIKLASDDSIITGFKGNMFRIDDADPKYTSIFYDNTKYSSISKTAAVFTGAGVIPTNIKDKEHSFFHIDSSNNTLTLSPNGLGTHTITLADGDYNITQMVSALNTAFTNDGLNLTASSYTSGSFNGIRITSSVYGVESSVGIDAASSAYNTLFTKRVYNVYSNAPEPVNEDMADSAATFTGGKTFSTGDNLTITSGQNDSFKITLTDVNRATSSYNITLDAGTYNSASLVNHINDKLNGTSALAGYKDKLEASVYNGRIRLTTRAGSGLTKVEAEANGSNTGYSDIFVGKRIDYTTGTLTASGNPPTITLPNAFDGSTSLNSSNNKLTLKINGSTQTIDLGTGNSQSDIINKINQTFPGSTSTVDNTFPDANGTGRDIPNTFTKNDNGSQSSSSASYNNTGSAGSTEGVVGDPTDSVPAKITTSVSVPSNYVVSASNNSMQLTINGTTHNITIAEGTYSTPQALANALQASIDNAFGKYYGGAVVSLDSGNHLVLTARLNKSNGSTAYGDTTSISCGTSTSTLLKDLHTTKYAASITTNAMQSAITIDSSNNIFKFKLTENGVASEVSLTLSSGSYTPSTIAAEINKQLQNRNIAVTATNQSGSTLTLTTSGKGNGYGLYLNSADCGNASEALFGPTVIKTTASITPNQIMQTSITIDDSHNEFTITVDGVVRTVTLDNGTYTREQFKDMLNNKFSAASVGVTASVSSGKLTLTGTSTGTSASLSMTYAGGGSSMSAIYGQTTTTTPKITASFNNDNKLVLKGDTPFSVVSSSNSLFYTSTGTTTYIYPDEPVPGYISSKKSYIDGVSLTSPVAIDRWNNELNFTYTHNGATTNYSITIADGNYDFANLQSELQTKLDNVTGSNLMTVTVNADGVRIEANDVGSKYKFSNFSGDFYDKVMGSCTERTQTLTATNVNGRQTNDAAYTIGRKDVRNNISEIKAGINDELSVDLTYGNTTMTFSMTLDAGSYSGSALVSQIQGKLNEQLVAAGLKENTITVGIGNHTTGVTGANDANALYFELNTSVPLPSSGSAATRYIIDGVSGNAAFTVFYQTDGEIDNAYVKGAKDISEGVTIIPSESELSFKVDGTAYTLTIPEGDYTSEEIINELNSQLTAAGAPITAENENGNLKLFHHKFGTHHITDISGSAKSVLFFEEKGSTEPEEPLHIQLSSRKDDSLEIERPRMTTSFLGINSSVITKPKYANKALTRLQTALEKVSEARSSFGSAQNRLEHAIANNHNNSENTSAAESRLRDTDMAVSVSEHARYVILEQAAQAMQAQANNIQEGVLKLLS